MNYNYEEEYIEPVYMKVDEVSNEGIVKGEQYQLCKDITDICITTIFGDNRLIVKDDGIHFIMQDNEPFKYHRGVLGLEQEAKLYVGFAKEFFGKIKGFTVDGRCDIEDCFMTHCIALHTDNTDVSKFVATLLDFESEFKTRHSIIEDKIREILDRTE